MRSFDNAVLLGYLGNLLFYVVFLSLDDTNNVVDVPGDGFDLHYTRRTKSTLSAKMRPSATTALKSICTSHSKKRPRKGMSVHETTTCSSQKAIHLAGCSRLKTVPMKGMTKQVRKTRGDNSMMRNIKQL